MPLQNFTSQNILGFAVCAFAASFIISFLLSPLILKELIKLHFGQEIRELGPKSHIKKAGTPTMGGFIFIIASVVVSIAASVVFRKIPFELACFILFGTVGFLDDFIKVRLKRNLGLDEKQKLVMQILFSVLLSLYAYHAFGSKIHIPFIERLWDLGYFYVPFTAFTMVACANAVNLTDGLDGLAASVTFFASTAFAAVSYILSSPDGMIFALAIAGALAGFLRVNWHPAKCFMGDTGSMALGGGISGMAIINGLHFWIIIIGFIYFIETLSVIIQVTYYKRTKKRIFKMSPYHHHLELSGYNEVSVAKIFSAVTVICGILGIFAALAAV